MNLLPLLKGLSPLWWLLRLLLLLGILRSPWFKGLFGESLVRMSVYLRLPAETYRALHNVTLQTSNGTTQIDHIIVSRFGVFVIETKHMTGWIFGREQDPQWTQSIFGKSFRFQNPLRQNYKHVKAVEAVLGKPADVIHSLVVFSGGSVFKSALPANVVRGGGYVDFIRSFQYKVFSDAEVSELLERIRGGQLPKTFTTRRAHIENLRSRRDPVVEAKTCSKCGDWMVLRTARTGANAGAQFWGCASFPKCRAVQAIR